MKVLPLCFLGQLSEADLARHECSDRIWVYHRLFERLTTDSDVGVATIVKLTNRVDQSVPGVVYAAHYMEEDAIYAPAWINAELLHDTDDVTCERFYPSLGTQITVLPHTSDHLLDSADPQLTLRDGFEQYTCLIKGLDYMIWLGEYSFTVTLTDLNPAGQEVVCIRGSELELELLAPLDAPTQAEVAEPTPAPTQVVEPTQPVAAPAPAAQGLSAEERRAAIAAAARRRMEALRMGSQST